MGLAKVIHESISRSRKYLDDFRRLRDVYAGYDLANWRRHTLDTFRKGD
jgi:hypothetical protein